MTATWKTFTYSAQRSAYLSIVGAFTFLILVEGGVIALLIALFAPAGLIRLSLFSTMIGLYMFAYDISDTLLVVGYTSLLCVLTIIDSAPSPNKETPITMRRLWLLNLSPMLLAVGLVLVWRLPALLALPALVLLEGVVLAVAWRFSRAYLRRLLT